MNEEPVVTLSTIEEQRAIQDRKREQEKRMKEKFLFQLTDNNRLEEVMDSTEIEILRVISEGIMKDVRNKYDLAALLMVNAFPNANVWVAETSLPLHVPIVPAASFVIPTDFCVGDEVYSCHKIGSSILYASQESVTVTKASESTIYPRYTCLYWNNTKAGDTSVWKVKSGTREIIVNATDFSTVLLHSSDSSRLPVGALSYEFVPNSFESNLVSLAGGVLSKRPQKVKGTRYGVNTEVEWVNPSVPPVFSFLQQEGLNTLLLSQLFTMAILDYVLVQIESEHWEDLIRIERYLLTRLTAAEIEALVKYVPGSDPPSIPLIRNAARDYRLTKAILNSKKK